METTEKAQHTPGPWEVDGMAIVGGGQDICYMGELAQWSGGTPNVLPNSDANALLISAAPDLLKALMAIIKSGHAISQPLRWAAEEAIAKATGAA